MLGLSRLLSPPGLARLRIIVATFARPWVALTCGHATSWDDVWLHSLGMSRVLTRDTPVDSPVLLSRASFPLIFVINKDAVLFAVASFGPYGARNNNETATRLTTRMSETPVFITWRRRHLETPHLRPRQRQRVVNTILCLGGHVLTNTGVSISRSRPLN